MARKSRKNLEQVVETEVTANVYNAAAYLRLSSDDKKKRGDSLATQRDIIENFIATNSDIRLTEVYTDNNATGTNFDRPGFQRMLADCENGKINCIIIKDLTRFGRNAIDAGFYLEKHLPSLNVRVIAVTDDYDSNEGDGGILLPLKNIIAESYALDISCKCRSVKLQNMKDGRFNGRIAPYGYAKDPADCYRFVIDPVAAVTVRQIFDWAASGIVPREIARRLNDNGVISPSRYKHLQGIVIDNKQLNDEFWQRRMIDNILVNKVYIGDMVQGKKRVEHNHEVKVPREQWICVENTHEAIVCREQFELAARVRAANTAHDKNVRRETIPYSQNLFKGKIFCAHCGHVMHRHRQNKDGVYWFRCQSQIDIKKDACVQVSVKESELKTEILTLLHKQSEAVLGKFIRIETANIAVNEHTAELRAINTELNGTGRYLKSLYESLVTGIIDADEFKQMKADYEAKIATLSERADEIRGNSREAESTAVEYRDLVDAVSASLHNETLTGKIIDRLVDKILVRQDKSVEVYFKYADEFKEVHADERLHDCEVYQAVA
jgi:DNA invertase Pin-like site-specific DNA recombinase